MTQYQKLLNIHNNRNKLLKLFIDFIIRNVFSGLEARTQYRYRLKCVNDSGSSAWSAAITVSTTKKPLTSEDLQRAVTKGDAETVRNILPGEKNVIYDRVGDDNHVNYLCELTVIFLVQRFKIQEIEASRITDYNDRVVKNN